MKRLLSAFALAATLGLATTACGAVTPYAATVNGERITQRELDRELEDIKGNQAYVDALSGQIQVEGSGVDTFDAAFVARVLTRRIVLELVDQEVERRELSISAYNRQLAEEEVKAGFAQDPTMYTNFDEAYRDELIERTATVNRLQEALAEVTISEETIEEYYAEHEAEFAQTCVSHILVATAEEATAIKARLDAGEEFGAIASAESTDPGSGQAGGALGCHPSGTFVPEFEAAMAALDVDQVSEPVQTQFGSHLIKVTDRQAQPISEVRSQIRQALLEDSQLAFNELVDELLADADITVNPRYGRFERTESGSQVVPPQAPTTTTTAPPLDTGPEGVPFGGEEAPVDTSVPEE